MGFIGGDLAYRFLRFYAPTGAASMLHASAYAGKSKIRTLLGEKLMSEIRGREVIDFGCGEGDETIEMALAGARFVTGLDIQDQRFPAARTRAVAAGVGARVAFLSSSAKAADVIVCIDSFEHFGDPAEILGIMASLLKPSGQVIASFGPTWYHPLGGHLFSVFPFAHLLFTEAVLIRWRADFKTDGATKFSEVAGGLNQMTVARFIALVEESPLKIDRLETVPIRKLKTIANHWTREFTTAIVRCTLVHRDRQG